MSVTLRNRVAALSHSELIYHELQKTPRCGTRMRDSNSSMMYQVKNFINYSSNENIDMLNHLHFDLSRSNQKKHILKSKAQILKQKLITSEISLSLFKNENTYHSLSNKFLFSKKKILMNLPKRFNLSLTIGQILTSI